MIAARQVRSDRLCNAILENDTPNIASLTADFTQALVVQPVTARCWTLLARGSELRLASEKPLQRYDAKKTAIVARLAGHRPCPMLVEGNGETQWPRDGDVG